MPEPDVIIGQGDTGPSLQEVLLGPDGGPLDLTTASGVKLLMQRRDRGDAVIEGLAAVVGDGVNGLVQHDWLASETDLSGMTRFGAGVWFNFQWQVTFNSGQIITVPETRYRSLFIRRKIA